MKIQYKIFSILILVVVAILLGTAGADQTDENFHLYVFDVGQGDSLYARDAQGEDILIDGGPDLSVLTQLGQVMPFNDRAISYVMLTHPHADHLFGLVEVLKRYDVKNIIMTDALSTTQEYQEFLNLIKEKNIPVILAQAGIKIAIDNNFNFSIIYPDDSFNGREINNLNNTSIVGKLIFGNVKIMSTGDTESDLQGQLAQKFGNTLKSDIYKIPHHGAKDSINNDFLKYVNPELAIIPVGLDNKFGHPHTDTIKALGQKDIKILRTDQNSTIEIISDGINFWMK